MPSYVFPKKNTEYVFYAPLTSQADTKLWQVNPTIAAGDFKVSTDGAAFGNLNTLPAVTPAAGTMVKFTLSAAEMNGDNIQVVGIDVAGAEWCNFGANIQTTTKQADDLATPANVNTEVLDVLNVDTFAETSGVPAATATLVSKISRLYDALKSGFTITATDKSFKNDAGVAQWKKPLSDDGTTYTEDKGETP
jgi:hypothetical protein